MAHKEGDRQNSYTKGIVDRPKQTKPGDVLQWKDLPKKASKKVDKKAFDSNFS